MTDAIFDSCQWPECTSLCASCTIITIICNMYYVYVYVCMCVNGECMG